MDIFHIKICVTFFLLLDWDLATDFPLNSGAQTVTLPPDLETKTSYIIVVMGDSGNASPKFTIKASRPLVSQ